MEASTTFATTNRITDSTAKPPRRKKQKRGRPSKLIVIMSESPELYHRMLERIRLGAFGWVAAESLGIPAETFCRWLARGAKEKRGPFRQFHQDVRQAQAHARLLVEITVAKRYPKFWLRCGPGRSQPGRPGWTDVGKGGSPAHRTLESPARQTGEPLNGERVPSLVDALRSMIDAGYVQPGPMFDSLVEAERQQGLDVND